MSTLRTDLPDADLVQNREIDVYLVSNGIQDDWGDADDLLALVKLYEMDGKPFTVQRFPAGEVAA